MKYADVLDYIARLSHYGEKLGLARMSRLCDLAAHPEREFPSVLVGGTNGKGSTSTMLGAILQQAGYRVGTAPKPHLHTHRERLQVDGVMIGEEEIGALVEEVQPWVAEVASDPACGQPTVFEVITLLAFLHYARRKVDWAVVEVGLGGRFDATNVLEPRLCLITNIGLDHTDRLGETLEEIAFEKAGILRAGVPAITGAAPPALGVIEAQAGELGAPLWRLGQEIRVSDIHVDATGGGFHLELPGEALPGLTVGMRGRHQIENAALAAAAAVRLRDVGARVPEAAIRAGLASAVIPGRLEVIGARPTVLLDAAHNPDGARALAAALEELFGDRRRLLLVLAVSRLHDPAEVVGILAPLADHVFATASSHPAATPAAETAELARAAVRGAGKALVTEVPTVAAAVAAARAEAEPEDLICVAGSIYALGEVPRSFTTSSSK